tara:strand:+ start:1607 stop:2059 length:453 start_codon:yes stop_codon:yes gene_type:complete
MKVKNILIIFSISISILSCTKEYTFRFNIQNETDQRITLLAYYLENSNPLETSQKTIEPKATEMLFDGKLRGDIASPSVLRTLALPLYFDLPRVDSLCISFDQDGKKLCFKESDINQPEFNILFNEFDENSGWWLTDTYIINEKHRSAAK